MRVSEIVAAARVLELQERASPAEAMIGVLLDLFTGSGSAADATQHEVAELGPDSVQRAWERLTRDLSVPEWLLESQALADGVDVLAANLVEAGRADLAARLRSLHEPRFGGLVRSPEATADRLRLIEEAPAGDNRLWVPRPSTLGRGA